MNSALRIVIVAATAVTLAACSVPPGFKLRDHFLGDKLVDRLFGREHAVDHDAQGQPVVADPRPATRTP